MSEQYGYDRGGWMAQGCKCASKCIAYLTLDDPFQGNEWLHPIENADIGSPTLGRIQRDLGVAEAA